MKRTLQNIDLIDRYFRNKLSDEELATVNRLLKTDKDFEKIFFDMDQLISGIRFSSRSTSMEEKLEKLENSLPLMKPADAPGYNLSNLVSYIFERTGNFIDDLRLQLAISLNKTKLALSGVAATILVIISLLFNYQRNLSPIVLYQSNFHPFLYENFAATREAGDKALEPQKVLFYKAMVEYNQKNYQASVNILGSIPAAQRNPEMELYMAIDNMHLENYGSAKRTLNEIIATADESWANQARWYLGLCMVREKNYPDAITLLAKVKDFGGEHSREAGKLLNKIK